MLFLAVTWGLLGTTGVLGKRVSKATATTVHQYLGAAVLPLLAIHLGGLLVDKFRPFGILDLLLPLHSGFRPLSVAFGVLALYATVIVLITSWMRSRIGARLWRALHLAATPALILAMVHGIFTGSDSARPWLWWMYVITGSVVLFLLLVRAMTVGERPERKPLPAGIRSRGPAPPAAVKVAPPAELPTEESDVVPASHG
jgi:sulfoxide reductase heme-binding subunit YedZ